MSCFTVILVLCTCNDAHQTNYTATEIAEDDEEMADQGQDSVVAPVVGGVVAVALIIAIAVVIIMITWIRSHRNYSVTTSSTGYVHCINILCMCMYCLGCVYLWLTVKSRAIVVCNCDLHCTASIVCMFF